MSAAVTGIAGAGGTRPSAAAGLPATLPPWPPADFPAVPGFGGTIGERATECRSRYQLLLSGRALAEKYRQIYTASISDQGYHLGRNKKF